MPDLPCQHIYARLFIEVRVDKGYGSNRGTTQNEKSLSQQGFIDFRCYPEIALFEPRPLSLLWQFFRFHRYRLRFAFPIRNSYPTDIPRKVPLNCQGSVIGWIDPRPAH